LTYAPRLAESAICVCTLPKYLAREFYPVFGEDDFVNLPNYHIYLKLMIDGVTSKAFSAVTLAPGEGEKSHRDEINEASRKIYGKLRAAITREVYSQRQFESKNKAKQRRLF